MPVDVLAQVAADQRRREGADVDPHVEDREPAIAAGVVLGIELPDHDRDVRLQQAGTDHDEPEPCVERGDSGNRHREVAERDDDPAQQNGLPLPEEPVSDPAAREVDQIHEARVKPVDQGRLGDVVAQPAVRRLGGHEQHEQRSHPVVRETLEHLRKEEVAQPDRMAEEACVVRSEGASGVAGGEVVGSEIARGFRVGSFHEGSVGVGRTGRWHRGFLSRAKILWGNTRLWRPPAQVLG